MREVVYSKLLEENHAITCLITVLVHLWPFAQVWSKTCLTREVRECFALLCLIGERNCSLGRVSHMIQCYWNYCAIFA